MSARIRTGYSFNTAYGHLKKVAARLTEIGLLKQPITDRNSCFAYQAWVKAVPNPVFGVELLVTNSPGGRRPALSYWTFLARDAVAQLSALVGAATDSARCSTSSATPFLFYPEATMAEGVIKLAGEATQIQFVEPAPDLYLLLSPATSKGLYRLAKDKGIPAVAASENYYTLPEEKELYRLALGRRSSTQSYPMHILTDDEWLAACRRLGTESELADALANRSKVLNSCNATLKKASLINVEHPATLLEMCQEGATRLGVDLTNPIYSARLDKELGLIEEKKFGDYFYIIADVVNYAKQHMIVGPARGSSCGSLVCYLLNITAIDPIPFDLLFERFIDINRTDLPDIDIDFSQARRDMVMDYVARKYGREQVSRLGTVSDFKPRSILQAAGAGLAIPRWRCEQLNDVTIERSSGDARANDTLLDTFTTTETGKKLLADYPALVEACKLEGHPHNTGKHAAGVVVTQEPVTETIPVDKRSNTAMCDKYDAEALGMLKIDVLGLTQLTIFERVAKLLGWDPRNGWLEKIPLNDPAAIAVLNRQHFAGIFQYNGKAVQSVTKAITVDHINDIMAITAIARPGPLATGGAIQWINRKNGLEPVRYPHPLLETWLKETLGIFVYQEQIMFVARNVGDLSWKQVSIVRKAMSASLGKEYLFRELGLAFIQGAQKNGMGEAEATKLWNDMSTFGSWAFNKSHAVAYGMLSYWCCWLKAHYPMEFAAATLDMEGDALKQIALLRELKEEDIRYVPVDVDKSNLHWSIAEKEGEKRLVGPLTLIKNIGPATATKIIQLREEARQADLPMMLTEALAKRLANPITAIDTLTPIADAVKRQWPNLADANIISTPTPIKKLRQGEEGALIIGLMTRLAPRDENDPQKIASRGYKITRGPTTAIHMFIRDDTDEIFCKINRFEYHRLAGLVLEKGKVGSSIFALKGKISGGKDKEFKMMWVEHIRYLGELALAKAA